MYGSIMDVRVWQHDGRTCGASYKIPTSTRVSNLEVRREEIDTGMFFFCSKAKNKLITSGKLMRRLLIRTIVKLIKREKEEKENTGMRRRAKGRGGEREREREREREGEGEGEREYV